MNRNTYHNYYKLIYCLILVFFAVSCQKASELDVPSYISIHSISVNVSGNQGSSSQKIVDAWVYTDNDLEGAFELPANFPVLKSGASELIIKAGIKLNGMSETRVDYPFYNPIILPVTLKREKAVELDHLTTSYKSNTKFAWLEDFEDPNLSIDTSAYSSIKITRSSDTSLIHAFPSEVNNFAAKAVIKNDSALFECVSHDFFFLPKDGSEVFMELNYKTNTPFVVGLMIYGSQIRQQPVLWINPSSVWNKIYINFTPTVSVNNDAVKFKVFLSAKKTEGGPDAEIFFDNIKLLHF